MGFGAKCPYADGALLSQNIPYMVQNIRDGVFFDSEPRVCDSRREAKALVPPVRADNEAGRY